MLQIVLLAMIGLVTTARAEVTPAAVQVAIDHVRSAPPGEERAAAAREYERLVTEARAALGFVSERKFHSQVGTYVLRHPLRPDPPVTVNFVGTLPGGIFVLIDHEGRTEVALEDHVRPFRIVSLVERARAGNRLGWSFARVNFDSETFWIIVADTWTASSVLRPDEFSIGRAPADPERVAVVRGEDGQPRPVNVTTVFPDDYLEIDSSLHDASPGGPRPSLPHAQMIEHRADQPGWVERDGRLWPITTIGSFGGRDVQLTDAGPVFVTAPLRAIANSPLLGQTVVQVVKGKPRRLVNVAYAIENGAIATDRGEVLMPGEFTPDETGEATRTLLRRGRGERFVDVMMDLPLNLVNATIWFFKRSFTRVLLTVNRLRAPRIDPGETKLGWYTRVLSQDKKVSGRRITAGNEDNPLVPHARYLARRFGAKTYVKTVNPSPGGAFVKSKFDGVIVAYNEDADPTTRAHEKVHVRNSYAHERGLLTPRTNHFRVSAGKGFRFLERYDKSSYQTYFRADEAEARTAEVGLLIKDLAQQNLSKEQVGNHKLWQEAWQHVTLGRTFLDTISEEVPLLREAILADGGRASISQYFGALVMRRPIPRRTADEDANRWASMTVNHFTWNMNREQRVAYALERLDDMVADNEKIAAIYDWQEKQLVQLGGPKPDHIVITCEQLFGDLDGVMFSSGSQKRP